MPAPPLSEAMFIASNCLQSWLIDLDPAVAQGDTP
jgi:hypothetical protein